MAASKKAAAPVEPKPVAPAPVPELVQPPVVDETTPTDGTGADQLADQDAPSKEATPVVVDPDETRRQALQALTNGKDFTGPVAAAPVEPKPVRHSGRVVDFTNGRSGDEYVVKATALNVAIGSQVMTAFHGDVVRLSKQQAKRPLEFDTIEPV